MVKKGLRLRNPKSAIRIQKVILLVRNLPKLSVCGNGGGTIEKKGLSNFNRQHGKIDNNFQWVCAMPARRSLGAGGPHAAFWFPVAHRMHRLFTRVSVMVSLDQ